MLRAILKHSQRDGISGASGEYFQTVEFNAPELENALRVGGLSEDGFHIVEVIGVEVPPLKNDHDTTGK